MSRLNLLLIGFCLCVSQLSAAEVHGQSAPKTLSPLQVSIHAAADSVQGGAVDYVVQVWSAIDLNDVQVQISFPEAAQLIQGQPDLQINLLANQVQTHLLTIKLPETISTAVQVTASHDQGQGARFAATAQYPEQTRPALAVTAGLGGNAPREMQRGERRVMEYKAR